VLISAFILTEHCI